MSERYSLNEPLPPEVVVASMGGPFGYRRFATFSAPWLRGRAFVFGGFICLLAIASGVGNGVASDDVAAGIRIGAWTFISFMLMSFAGPTLAAWVRTRSWRRERAAVIAAVVIGMGLAASVDQVASTAIARDIPKELQVRSSAEESGPAKSSPTSEMIVRVERSPLTMAISALFGLAIYFCLGGGLALRAYLGELNRWRESQRQRELQSLLADKRASEWQLHVLQAQIEPHFLFNTLAAVRSTLRADAGRAEATLDALVEYLRATIPKLRADPTALSTVAQQVEIARHYLTVMQLRMGDRLRIEIDIDPTIAAAAFPPLALVSLVENAIKHGLEPQRMGGCISIIGRRAGANVRVIVRDDGIGLGPGNSGSGLGLRNLRSQLQQRYGDSASLTVQTPATGGFEAIVEVPCEA
jgi:signal transduction histidine kinase